MRGVERVLVLGGTGSLGTALTAELRKNYTVSAAQRLDVNSIERLHEALAAVRPDAIVNCIGVTPSSPAGADPVANIEVNSRFPHLLAGAARSVDAYVVHISTDAVFSGLRGPYSESDNPDPIDLYGRSKLLGEVTGEHCLTLRTTFFGPSPSGRGLVEWLLGRGSGAIEGYSRYLFSGLSTIALSRTISRILSCPRPIVGIYHLGGEPMSKHELLTTLVRELALRIVVQQVDGSSIDRRLDSHRIWADLGEPMPDKLEMIRELCRALAPRVRSA